MKRLASLIAIVALVGADVAQAQAVPQTGAVVAGGVTTTPLPTTTFIQSCNAGLGGIVGQGSCALPTSGGGGGGGGGGAVTIADGADVTLGAQADALYSGSGAASLIAIDKSIRALLAGTLTVSGTVGARLLDNSGNPFGTSGNPVYVSGGGGGGGNAAASATGAAVPTAAGYTGFSVGGNLTGVSAANPLPVTVGSAATPITQGVATAGASSLNVYVGGSVTQPVQGTAAQAATFNTTTNPIIVGGCTGVASSACSSGNFAPVSVNGFGAALTNLYSVANNLFPGSASHSASQSLAVDAQMELYGTSGNTWTAHRDLQGVTGASTNGVAAVGAFANVGYLESSVAQAANATVTGTGRAAPVWASYFQCKAYSDQTGTIVLQQSDDSGTNYFPLTATTAIAAAGPMAFVRANLSGPSATTLFRCVEVNGATAQTVNRLTVAFSAN